MLKNWLKGIISDALKESIRDFYAGDNGFQPDVYDYFITKIEDGNWLFRFCNKHAHGSNTRDKYYVFTTLEQLKEFIETQWVKGKLGV